MPDFAGRIRDNIFVIQERIDRVAERVGRSPREVALMAVTKFNPAESVLAAYHAGLRLFGENRVQEAYIKFFPIKKEIDTASLHMIGTLQKNKINRALTLFDALQGVDSVETLEAILSRIGQRSSPLLLYFELHTGEESKAGFPSVDEMLRACDAFASFLQSVGPSGSFVKLKGLMTMAPFTSDSGEIRRSFRKLVAAKQKVAQHFSFPDFDQLSMGMSNDFEIAIEEGATIVRIGTAIFGQRGP